MLITDIREYKYLHIQVFGISLSMQTGQDWGWHSLVVWPVCEIDPIVGNVGKFPVWSLNGTVLCDSMHLST